MGAAIFFLFILMVIGAGKDIGNSVKSEFKKPTGGWKTERQYRKEQETKARKKAFRDAKRR